MENLIPSDLTAVVAAETSNDAAGENVVPFLYVITGTYASELLMDSLKPKASMPAYLADELCIGARQVGNKPSAPSKYATALAKSKVISSSELKVSFTISTGTSSRAGTLKSVLEITEKDFEFLIANIAIVLAVAILGGVEHCAMHPKSEDGDDCMADYGAAKATGTGLVAAPIEDTFQPIKQTTTIEFGPAPTNGEKMATEINYNAGTQIVIATETHTQGQHPFASTDFGLTNTTNNFSPRDGEGSPPHASTPSPQPAFNHAGALAAADGFGDGGFGLAAGGTAIEMTALPGQHTEANVAGWYPANTAV
jgi:hypothetical protein